MNSEKSTNSEKPWPFWKVFVLCFVVVAFMSLIWTAWNGVSQASKDRSTILMLECRLNPAKALHKYWPKLDKETRNMWTAVAIENHAKKLSQQRNELKQSASPWVQDYLAFHRALRQVEEFGPWDDESREDLQALKRLMEKAKLAEKQLSQHGKEIPELPLFSAILKEQLP